MEALTLTQLIAARIAAKRDEDAAVAERRKIDAAIAALLKDPAKPEGTISQKAGDYKVIVTYKVDRKVDAEKLQADWAKLGLDIQAIFKWSPSLQVGELRKLEPKAALQAAKYYEAKDASPQIKIEAI